MALLLPHRRLLLQPYNVRHGNIYEGLVATRAGNATAHNGGSAGVGIMMRTGHVATVPIRRFKIAVGNYRYDKFDIAETGNAGTLTVKAGVEYNGQFARIWFPDNGGETGNVAALGQIESGYVDLPTPIPAGATFQIRQFLTQSVNYNYAAIPRDSAKGDAIDQSSATDQTMGGTVVNDFASVITPPVAIIGMTNQPSIFCIGDSITFGSNDTSTINDFRRGIFAHGFPVDTCAFLNLGKSSTTARTTGGGGWHTGSPQGIKLLKYGSHFLDGLGHNDIFGSSDSAATLLANLRQNIYSLFPPGARVYRSTLTPKSSSNATTPRWQSDADQTTNTNNSIRVTFNGLVRAGIVGVTDYFEIADQVESARDNGKWIGTVGTDQVETTDGIHPTAAGNALCANAIVMTKLVN
jgi:lysophospholipase L1-like esterase